MLFGFLNYLSIFIFFFQLSYLVLNHFDLRSFILSILHKVSSFLLLSIYDNCTPLTVLQSYTSQLLVIIEVLRFTVTSSVTFSGDGLTVLMSLFIQVVRLYSKWISIVAFTMSGLFYPSSSIYFTIVKSLSRLSSMAFRTGMQDSLYNNEDNERNGLRIVSIYYKYI